VIVGIAAGMAYPLSIVMHVRGVWMSFEIFKVLGPALLGMALGRRWRSTTTFRWRGTMRGNVAATSRVGPGNCTPSRSQIRT
jgi:hypothetical protein